MLIYYKKNDDSIDIHNMTIKKDKVKLYRESELGNSKEVLYSLETSNGNLIPFFEKTHEIDIKQISFNYNSRQNKNVWSRLNRIVASSDCEEEYQNVILENYINGKYDQLVPTRVFEYDWDKEQQNDMYYFIKPEGHRVSSQDANIISSTKNGKSIPKEDVNIYEMKNIISLNKNLYILQLLEQGRFEEVVDEDIEKQLKLFDISFVENISLKDIERIINTGLVGGTLDDAINKALVGSKILKKVLK